MYIYIYIYGYMDTYMALSYQDTYILGHFYRCSFCSIAIIEKCYKPLVGAKILFLSS